MAAQQLANPVREPPRLASFPDGLQLWQCPRCGGYYQTETQAALTVEDRHRLQNVYHRCKSRPRQVSEDGV